MPSQASRRVSWLASMLALVVVPSAPSFALSFVESLAYAYAGYFDESGGTIDSEQDDGSSSTPGMLTSAEVLFCPVGPCTFLPSTPFNVTSYAETAYGMNRASASAAVQESYPNGESRRTDSAETVSRWQDEWTLAPGPVGSPSQLEITVGIDGSWANSADFTFLLTIVDPSLGTNLGDDGFPVGLIAYGLVTNCAQGGTSLGCNFPASVPLVPIPGVPLPPGRSVIQVNPNGDPDGSFDTELIVSAPYVANETYLVGAGLFASTGPFDFSVLDAFSTAQITRVLVPQGGGLSSAAGALASYPIVSVPEPGAALLAAAGLAALAARRRRMPSR